MNALPLAQDHPCDDELREIYAKAVGHRHRRFAKVAL